MRRLKRFLASLELDRDLPTDNADVRALRKARWMIEVGIPLDLRALDACWVVKESLARRSVFPEQPEFEL
ncbi:MAG: hypothetical protein GXP48_12580 [Acidobacteria bacterium]|nr:hypothetical protein [Acidobacteriota bacterium]